MGVQQHWSITANNNGTADSAVNMAERQAPSTVNDAVRAAMAQIKKTQLDQNGTLLTTGGATAYTVTTNEVLTALVDGTMLTVQAHITNGATPTFAPDGLTAKPIYSLYATAVPIGSMLKDGLYRLVYRSAANSSSGAWILHGAAGILAVPVGSIFDWPSTGSLPPLCLEANGAAVSRTTYAALFAVYGTTHGTGDGSTTFNIPDLGGRVTVGKEASASRVDGTVTGIDTTTVGDTGGEDKHTLSGSESGQKAISAAPVDITDPGHLHANTKATGTLSVGGVGSNVLTASYGNSASATTGITAALTLAASSAGSAHNNMPPAMVTRKLIFAGA